MAIWAMILTLILPTGVKYDPDAFYLAVLSVYFELSDAIS